METKIVNTQRAITPKVGKPELRFMCSAPRLMVFKVGVKFHENVSRGFTVRPEFFYFLVLGSADPNFWKSRIKIKLGSKSFIFILSADRLMPLTNEIKARTSF